MKNKGFTLIELTIVLMIIGILMSLSLHVWQGYAFKSQIKSAKSELQKVDQHIVHFFRENGYFPCPADPKNSYEQQEYLREMDCDDQKLKVDPNKKKFFSEGRDKKVIITGNIPTRTLSLRDSIAKDPWGNYYQYTVTLDLANAFLYNDKGGAIEITDSEGVSLITPHASAKYVLMSYGQNGLSESCDDRELKGGNINSCNSSFISEKLSFGEKYYDDLLIYKKTVLPEENNNNCNVKNFLGRYKVKHSNENMPTVININETLLICNKKILEQFNENDHCITFKCGKEGKISRSEYFID